MQDAPSQRQPARKLTWNAMIPALFVAFLLIAVATAALNFYETLRPRQAPPVCTVITLSPHPSITLCTGQEGRP